MDEATDAKALKVSIRRAGMDLLARREHSTLELVSKLKRRCHDNQLIDEVLLQLQKDGLLSDFRFAETYVNSKARRGVGPRRIRRELRQKGVRNSLIEEAFLTSKVDWVAVRERVLHKKFGDCEAPDFQAKARRSRFLMQRGFHVEEPV